MTAWALIVIGLEDKLLRPMPVCKATLMPDNVVTITTLSGMVVFGIHGFVPGPVIAATLLRRCGAVRQRTDALARLAQSHGGGDLAMCQPDRLHTPRPSRSEDTS